VNRLIDTVERLRDGGSKVAVAGFSQGAAVVLVALRSGLVADAAVAVRGFFPEHDDIGSLPQSATATARCALLSVAGSTDEVVPEFLSSDAAALLASGGHEVTAIVEDEAHALSPHAADFAREWLVERTGRRMRCSISLPTDRVGAGEEFLSVDGIADLAAGYERLGFDGCYVTDHPAPDERWLNAGGHHALEPTVALAVAASATRHLRLHTNIYVLGYRNPFLAAKALASVDVVSGGRLIVGVAAGYLRPEFAALGANFDDRSSELDAALELLPQIWSGEIVATSGSDWTARGVRALPTPSSRPHPPLWVGGNSTAAMRRAVRFGQGWSPFPTPDGLATATRTASITHLDDLRTRIALLREFSNEAGRDELPTICFAPFSLAALTADPTSSCAPLSEEIGELADMGVSWITVEASGSTRTEVLDRAEEIGTALGLGRSTPRGE